MQTSRRLLNWWKPPPLCQLSTNHPLSVAMSGAYLFNEQGGGVYHNLGLKQVGVRAGGKTNLNFTVAGPNGAAPCDRGLGLNCTGVGYAGCNNPSQLENANTSVSGWSAACKFRIPSLPGAQVGVWSVGTTSPTEGSPGYLLAVNGSTNIRVLLGNLAYQVLVTPPVTGIWYTVVSTWNTHLDPSIAGTQSHYLGISGGSAALIQTSAITTGTVTHGDNLYVGSGSAGSFTGQIEFLYLWDRLLTYREALEICVNPYQMWEYPGQVGYLKPGAASFVPAWVRNSPVIGSGIY